MSKKSIFKVQLLKIQLVSFESISQLLVVYNYYFDNLIKTKKQKLKISELKKKTKKDVVIYFTICVHSKSIKILGLHYQELMGKIKEHEGEKIIVEDYILDKVLDKNKEVTGIEQFDDAKTFIDPDNKLIRIEKK